MASIRRKYLVNPLPAMFLVIFIAIIAPTPDGIAQSPATEYINQKSIGGFVSFGFPLYKLEEGIHYNPAILGGSIRVPLYQTHNNFGIGVGFLPQIGFLSFDNTMEYEFGLNITFTFGFQISPRSIFSINIGSGPHYITTDIGRQAPGFIFSDHINLAYRYKLNTWETGVTFGIRHISNAGLEDPNLGIENIGLGLYVGKLF
jgi:hypothetical protein